MDIDFNSLISKCENSIRSIARSYSDFNDYEDLLQEILTQLWRSYSNFRGDSKIETWVYRIAINTAITYQRSEIKNRKGKDASQKSEGTELDGPSQDEILRTFTNSIGKVDRAVLVLYLDGLTANEMESILGIKANAIKVRISRLKTKFKEQFVD